MIWQLCKTKESIIDKSLLTEAKNPYNKFYKKMGGKITKKIKSNIYGTILEENLIEFSI